MCMSFYIRYGWRVWGLLADITGYADGTATARKAWATVDIAFAMSRQRTQEGAYLYCAFLRWPSRCPRRPPPAGAGGGCAQLRHAHGY